MAATKLTDNVKVDNDKKILYIDFNNMTDADRNAVSLFSASEWTIKPIQKRAKSGGRFKKQAEYKKLLSEAQYKQFLDIKSRNGYFAAATFANNQLQRKTKSSAK